MFIVWGKKLVRRRVGYVADFCPICRVATPCELTRVGSASHVYYITSGDGELVGFERTCKACGTSFQAEPTHYASVSKKLLPLPDLKRETYPNMEQAWHDRLVLEDRVRTAPASLTPEERHALIRSPFLLLSPKVEQRFASTHIDKETGLAIVAALALMIIGPSAVRAVAPGVADDSVIVFILGGLGLIIWQGLASGRRYMRREVIPVLAKSLRPLRPKPAEVSAVIAEMKTLRHKMAKKLNVTDLYAYWQARSKARAG